MNVSVKMEKPEIHSLDWTSIVTLWSVLIAMVTVIFKWINSYHVSRKLEKESFIKSVVEAAMSGSMLDVNDKINTLFEYREKDRENLDRKFESMMKEIKK